MAALSFLEKHPDDFIGAERPPLNFQQLSGHRRADGVRIIVRKI